MLLIYDKLVRICLCVSMLILLPYVIYCVHLQKSQLSAAEAYNIKREILMSAHVVCSTLNGSGSVQLKNYLQKAPGEIPFTSLIIDEVRASF